MLDGSEPFGSDEYTCISFDDNKKEPKCEKDVPIIVLGAGKYIIRKVANCQTETLYVEIWESDTTLVPGSDVKDGEDGTTHRKKLVAKFNITKQYLEMMLEGIKKDIVRVTNLGFLAS